MNEFIKSQADIETSLADADRFQHSGVAQLAQDDLIVKLIWCLEHGDRQHEDTPLDIWNRLVLP